MRNKYYNYYQPNKKDIKDDYGDCVIRSLCGADNKEWVEVFEELVEYAREYQSMLSSKVCYTRYLTENGFTYTGISNKKGSKRPTVKSFTKGHQVGRYVLVVANHLVAVRDGSYYDTWDSGEKSLYGYWEKVG